MMARMSSVRPEAFSRSDRISNGLSSVMRDHMTMNSSRMDMLLGLGSQSQSPQMDASEINELKEEDIWGAADSRGWSEESPVAEVRKFDLGSYGTSGRDIETGSDHYRFFNGRRWLGIEKDPGLSVAYAEGGRARGVGFPSPLNRASGTGTPSREGASSRTPSRLIPSRDTKGASHFQISSAVESSKVLHQSAPVNVPDWSKILGTERKTAKEFVDETLNAENDDEDEERLPPHELIAREYSRSQFNTFSMCEGQGRTLKGRDLSRVRNTVLRQTGFLGE